MRSATPPGRRARSSRTRRPSAATPGRLRVAMTAANPLEVDVDPECVRGMHAAGELLASLGHEVEYAAPALPGGDVLGLFIQVFGPQVSLGIRYGELLAGREPEDDEIEPLSRAIFELAAGHDLGRLPRRARAAAGDRARASSRSSPSTTCCSRRRWPSARWPIGEMHRLRRGPDGRPARSGHFTPFTALFNVTGQPAISVPLGFGDDGLPTAAQLVAKPLGEDTLLQVAAQLEAALGRPQQVPDL